MGFLAFEGLDGSGKSTLIRRLTDELTARGVAFTLTREPGGTPLAEEIRGLLLKRDIDPPSARAELLLYEASRAQHVERVIRPGLARGEWVICDRFAASTVAFQCAARGLDRREVDWLNAYAVDGIWPELTVLLDLPVEESERRRASRSSSSGEAPDRMESEARTFHEAVRRGYLEQAAADPSRWLTLDAREAPDVLYAALARRLREGGWLK